MGIENDIAKLRRMGLSDQTIERERLYREALAEAKNGLMSPEAAREALMRLPPWHTS